MNKINKKTDKKRQRKYAKKIENWAHFSYDSFSIFVLRKKRAHTHTAPPNRWMSFEFIVYCFIFIERVYAHATSKRTPMYRYAHKEVRENNEL